MVAVGINVPQSSWADFSLSARLLHGRTPVGVPPPHDEHVLREILQMLEEGIIDGGWGAREFATFADRSDPAYRLHMQIAAEVFFAVRALRGEEGA